MMGKVLSATAAPMLVVMNLQRPPGDHPVGKPNEIKLGCQHGLSEIIQEDVMSVTNPIKRHLVIG
jgi:hypothetical protein